jgi:hypothetical protein
MNNSMTTMNRTQNRGLIRVLFVIYVSSLLSVGAEKVRCQQILQNKSLYWSEEFKWSPEEVLSKQIDIESIQAQVLDLLKK